MPDEARTTADDIRKLDEKVSKLSEETAANRTIGDLVKYLIYFWAAISAVLGFFGWSKFSDLDKIVEGQVQAQLPRDKQEFAKYKDLVLEAEELNKKYRKLAGDYEESVAALQYAKTTGADFDIEGKLTALIIESQHRKRPDPEQEVSPSLEGTSLEPKWRKDSIATLMIFRDSLGKKKFPADFIFNVTQVTRRLDQFQLAEELTRAAFEKDPTPPIRALYLSSKVSNTTGKEREASFKDLLGMVVSLPANSPEIVLAEAWNAAEDQRRYGEFIGALDSLIKSKSPIPSYVHVIRATAILRQSLPDSISRAEESLKLAKKVFDGESALSSWFNSTIRELAQDENQIQNSRMAIAAINFDQKGQGLDSMISDAAGSLVAEH